MLAGRPIPSPASWALRLSGQLPPPRMAQQRKTALCTCKCWCSFQLPVIGMHSWEAQYMRSTCTTGHSGSCAHQPWTLHLLQCCSATTTAFTNGATCAGQQDDSQRTLAAVDQLARSVCTCIKSKYTTGSGGTLAVCALGQYYTSAHWSLGLLDIQYVLAALAHLAESVVSLQEPDRKPGATWFNKFPCLTFSPHACHGPNPRHAASI
jgi:hypothetical protein